MQIGLPRGKDDELIRATVKKRAVDVEGRPIGKPNDNPLLDSRRYEVEYDDGTYEILSANTIAENLIAQVDEEGHCQLLLDEIIDHRVTNDAVPKQHGFITTPSGG